MTADPIEGAFVLNIGDMMRIWTNGLYRSTPHRVLRPAPGVGRRLSIPFFFEPNYDALASTQATHTTTRRERETHISDRFSVLSDRAAATPGRGGAARGTAVSVDYLRGPPALQNRE